MFEQVRYFFLESSHSRPASSLPVRIVAFRSEREYAPYRLSAGSFAYYERSHNRDYIVMQDIDPAHYPAAIHEYTHLIVDHLSLQFPVWLNEGLAEFYSSLEARGKQAVIGGVPPGRMGLLQSRPWLDLNLLLSVDRNSPYYNERDKMSIFYAQSWALTHMLEFGDAYRAGFPAFLSGVASGNSSEDMFHRTYGKDLVRVAADLRAYVHPSSLRAGLVDVNLPRSAFDSVTAPLTPFQTELALTDLLASQKKTWGEAAKRFASTCRRPSSRVSKCKNQWLISNGSEIRTLRPATTSPERLNSVPVTLTCCICMPSFSIRRMLPTRRYWRFSKRVVTARPGFTDAQLNLAMTAMNMQNWARAAVALSAMKTIKPDRAFLVFSAIATCDLSLGNIAAAREAAQQAQQYAQTADQKAEARKLVAQFRSIQEQPTELAKPAPVPPDTAHPPVSKEPDSRRGKYPAISQSIHWAGDLRHVESTALTLRMQWQGASSACPGQSRPMVFQIDDPNEILVRNAAHSSLELTCGPQQPFPLGVFYIPTPESGTITGRVRELVF